MIHYFWKRLFVSISLFLVAASNSVIWSFRHSYRLVPNLGSANPGTNAKGRMENAFTVCPRREHTERRPTGSLLHLSFRRHRERPLTFPCGVVRFRLSSHISPVGFSSSSFWVVLLDHTPEEIIVCLPTTLLSFHQITRRARHGNSASCGHGS